MELTKKEQELVKKQDFRNKSMEIEKNILDHPESISGDAFEKMNPTKSTFADGQYINY